MPSGMIRSGCGCHQASCTQSLKARVVARPSSGSEHWEYTRPQNPVIIEGKLSEAQMPARSMSWTRASTSKQPRRIWSKRNGSISTVSGRRPTTAFMPIWLWRWPSNSHTSWPRRSTTMRGARSWRRAGSRPSNMPAGSTRWSSTEMIVASTSRGSGSGRNRSVASSKLTRTLVPLRSGHEGRQPRGPVRHRSRPLPALLRGGVRVRPPQRPRGPGRGRLPAAAGARTGGADRRLPDARRLRPGAAPLRPGGQRPGPGPRRSPSRASPTSRSRWPTWPPPAPGWRTSAARCWPTPTWAATPSWCATPTARSSS